MDTVSKRARNVRLVCSDFDGVLTDGMVYTDASGNETVRCSRRDSLGIDMLKKAGITFHVISKETNPIVAARCKKMGVSYDQGVENTDDKLAIMMRVATEAGLTLKQVAYIGDDINDAKPLRSAGFSTTVANHHPSLGWVDYVAKARGGNHAVREICEYILNSQGHDTTQY